MLRACVLALCALQTTALVVAQTPRAVARMSSVRAPCTPQMKEVVRVEVEIEQGEPLEKALRRFRKITNVSGHLRLLRNRRTFESTHDRKIRKNKESLMRQARARRSARNRMQ